MEEIKITYPQYRKYPNNKSYFKILSSKRFEEIQILGTKKTIHFFDAKILPDKNYIFDLTFNYSNHWIVNDKKEYEDLKNTLFIK